MKYVITGASGHISKPLSLSLLKKGHQVSVIGRKKENLADLISAGAIPLIGSVEDPEFLKSAFNGADAVYTMVPPRWDAVDWKGYIGKVGEQYAAAIKANSNKYVVNLSSVGAHMKDGAGPVSGLYRVEQSLNALNGINVLHLRPGYFYDNFFGSMEMIRNLHILGGNSGDKDTKLIAVDTADIAEVAFQVLDELTFRGHGVRYICSDEPTNEQIAKMLGKAIGEPELSWISFSDEQTLNGMLAGGLPEEVAKNYTEMGAALRSGEMSRDYWLNRPAELGKTKFNDFARRFAQVYQGSEKSLVS